MRYVFAHSHVTFLSLISSHYWRLEARKSIKRTFARSPGLHQVLRLVNAMLGVSPHRVLNLPQCCFLEIHLGSESNHNVAPGSAARVCIVLNDRLQKDHRRKVYQRIEFNPLLCLEWWRAWRNKLLA